ncbi:GDSL esterase/lipase [Actinidia chinensis var. chinensis]|uniref:GDSL esterase/lipase n=1 Tax=Actinidia chinensis var. chinensis TaxID=1590841 RepID=A0A2R6PAP1_ACTCC|nr:GDSL esterase/lipase [Actinidia chinensis var. chinensis]
MRKREKKTRSVKMESSCSRLMVLSLAHATLILIGVSSNGITMASSSQFTAMFCFGDSLIDNGNNNYLTSLAKANYVPYGVDFYEGPSGRFSNGRTIIDYLGDLVGIPYLPAFANPLATGKNILRGVNFASAAAGILEETGRNLGQRFSLSQQVENFENTLSQLKNEMSDEEISQYLFKSLVIMILGSNDYINNYLVPSQYATSYIYNPKEYADLLIERYATQILALHSLGLRKFLLGGIGPLGCIPNQLATGLAPPGKCVSLVNDLVGMFNTQLISLVDQLNSKYPEAIFVYGNTYGAFGDILNNPTAYGFKVIDKGCCGIGRNQGQITCLPFSSPCIERNQYVFWDAFHPTQAVNQILARRAYNGPPSDCYPVNVQQMAQM